MTKNDLNLIGAFIDAKSPKAELNFAYLGDHGIFATDTRKVIFYSIPMLGLNLMLDKKILKGFVSVLGKDDEASIDGYGFIRTPGVKMSCDNWNYDVDVKLPDYEKMINKNLQNHFVLETIDDLQFELAQRNCFIDDVHLNPIIQFAECSKFDIFFEEQKEVIEDEQKRTNYGIVKIIGKYSTQDESDIVKFIAIVMGRTFESKAIEE